MPRCCQPDPSEFEPSYASVLVSGTASPALLRDLVEDLEQTSPICPCVTGWCSACRRVSLLVSSRGAFPCPSAHVAHCLALRARLESCLNPSARTGLPEFRARS